MIFSLIYKENLYKIVLCQDIAIVYIHARVRVCVIDRKDC